MLNRSARLTTTFLAVLLAAARVAGAQDAPTRYFRAVAHGRTVVVKDWTCWFPDCRYAPCHMRTVQAPRLGRIEPNVHRSAIPESGGNCAGKPIAAMSLLYTPRPGVHGSDIVVLETHSDNGSSHRLEVTVDVP